LGAIAPRRLFKLNNNVKQHATARKPPAGLAKKIAGFFCRKTPARQPVHKPGMLEVLLLEALRQVIHILFTDSAQLV
jgi:hypothetical protein